MNPILWIAVSVAFVVVLAHIALFWWFVCKPQKKNPGAGGPESGNQEPEDG